MAQQQPVEQPTFWLAYRDRVFGRVGELWYESELQRAQVRAFLERTQNTVLATWEWPQGLSRLMRASGLGQA